MRPWQYWTLFVVCLAVVFAAMGWVSVTVLRLDRLQAQAEQEAALEENVRLALWRMESAVAPLIVRESSRPYFVYTPFYPARRTYTEMFEARSGEEVMLPSPLLAAVTPQVIVHFQSGPDGRWTSPEAPAGKMRELAAATGADDRVIETAATRLTELADKITREQLLANIPENPHEPPESAQVAAVTAAPDPGMQQGLSPGAQQSVKNVQEWRARVQQQEVAQSRGKGMNVAPAQTEEWVQTLGSGLLGKGTGARVAEGPMKAFWAADLLLLARRVTVNGADYVQGCCLDWTEIKGELLDGVGDLLGGADLVPAAAQAGNGGARSLAGLPVRLVPGVPTAIPTPGLTPVRVSLIIAWGCVLLAAAAVATLLAGAVSLSERRAAFVSAVTHELRTPLTTFRMYTEMLSEDMVVEEARRRQYLATLAAEGSRLSHLVENVLSYARLERGRAAAQVETVSADAVLDRVKDRLSQRAKEAGMTLVTEGAGGTADARMRADVPAVEQILFNLVDNACKYAAASADKRIHIQAGVAGGTVRIRVRDHGPGIAREEQRRLFRPFRKSARHAAETAPGVGLGLALSRRLARQMGGDLTADLEVADGAAFDLVLPRMPARDDAGAAGHARPDQVVGEED